MNDLDALNQLKRCIELVHTDTGFNGPKYEYDFNENAKAILATVRQEAYEDARRSFQSNLAAAEKEFYERGKEDGRLEAIRAKAQGE